jgi:hypothetical protein
MVVTNDSLFILVPSNPDSIRNISQTLSSSPLKRPNPKRVQLAGVRKRGSRNLGLIEIAFELRLFKKMIILIARTSTSSEFQVTQVERLAAQSIVTRIRVWLS